MNKTIEEIRKDINNLSVDIEKLISEFYKNNNQKVKLDFDVVLEFYESTDRLKLIRNEVNITGKIVV